MDQSHLDKKYFIDGYKYNCPHCKRGSVSYAVKSKGHFNWNSERTVYIYLVVCQSCGQVSLHLSDFDFPGSHHYPFSAEPENYDSEENGEYDEEKLDEFFFYHQPTSFFTIDSRIKEPIRSLVSEAENSRQMNFLVGASGALRKAIYEFLQDQSAEGDKYDEKIKWLKVKYPYIEPTYFDALANIQGMTSENLHENEGSWEPWSNSDLKYLIQVVKTVLEEVYVLPKERSHAIKKINELRSKSTFKLRAKKDS